MPATIIALPTLGADTATDAKLAPCVAESVRLSTLMSRADVRHPSMPGALQRLEQLIADAAVELAVPVSRVQAEVTRRAVRALA